MGPHGPSLNTLSAAAFDVGTLNALSAECTHHICQQILEVSVLVLVLEVLEYKYFKFVLECNSSTSTSTEYNMSAY